MSQLQEEIEDLSGVVLGSQVNVVLDDEGTIVIEPKEDGLNYGVSIEISQAEDGTIVVGGV